MALTIKTGSGTGEKVAGNPDTTTLMKTDASNATAAGKAVMATIPMPSDTIISNIIPSTIGTTQVSYTAPAAGYIFIYNPSSIPLWALTEIGLIIGNITGLSMRGFIPVRAGKTVSFVVSSGQATGIESRFIYAEGAAP
ncbi:MAG: hypothetical protein LBT92_01515 [Rickettsiales bacterium]|nr:hypothetical protein [Rickettsiales bacterium]